MLARYQEGPSTADGGAAGRHRGTYGEAGRCPSEEGFPAGLVQSKLLSHKAKWLANGEVPRELLHPLAL
jgi:hypothetical protein